MANHPEFRGRHAMTAIALAISLSLLTAAHATAKMPYFSVEIAPPEPVAGQPVVITVRTWADVAHTVPDPFEAPDLHGLLVIRPTNGSSSSIGVPLHAREPGEFQATVVVPTAGEWMLVAFPDRSGWSSPEIVPGYPDTIAFSVRAQTDVISLIPAITGMAALLGVVVFLAMRGKPLLRRSGMSAAGESYPSAPHASIARDGQNGR